VRAAAEVVLADAMVHLFLFTNGALRCPLLFVHVVFFGAKTKDMAGARKILRRELDIVKSVICLY